MAFERGGQRSWLGGWALVAAAGVTPSAAATQADPVVVVQIEDAVAVDARSLAWAQELASGIYAEAGVTLRWNVGEVDEPDRRLTIVVTMSTALPRGTRSDAMGVAPTPGDGTRGTLAYVFLDKVAAFAASHRLTVAHVLACALAHEVGHLLLPPNAHRPDGVMRDAWHPALFPPKAPGVAGFPPDQARLLRLRARRQ
jgi:hypothetical protein